MISSCLSVPARNYRTEASGTAASGELPGSGIVSSADERSSSITEKSSGTETAAAAIGAEDQEEALLTVSRPRRDVTVYQARPIEDKAVHVPSKLMNAVFKSPQVYIEDLVTFLVEGEKDPFLKVKLIHDWIADNIAYDTEGYFSGNITSQAWANTLASRKSVCEGYAGLFEKMCGLAGFYCSKVSGHARGYGFSLFENERFTETNHAWNAVQIDGAWYLIDCTWDAGYIEGPTFLKRYSTAYLFIEPEAMIYSHFPENPKWQLLPRPRNAAAISEAPNYRGRYFLLGLEPIEGIQKLNRAGNTFQFSIPAPEDVMFSSRLIAEDGRAAANTSMLQYRENTAEVLVTFPSPGKWKLQLFAKRSSDEGHYMFILSLGFIAESGSLNLLPVIYQSFIEDRCYIHSPRYSGLPTSRDIDFKLTLPGYSEAYVYCGSKRYPLSAGENYLFAGTVRFTEKDDIIIFASKESDPTSYTGIVGYAPAD
jgi:hypothetical protein